MALYISSLNSGSNGNCYYLGNEQEAVLVDAGISCRELERRMKRLNLQMSLVKAVFISHEHSDHVRGLEGLARKHGIPVYITPLTLQAGHLRLDESLINTYTAFEPVQIGEISVTPFPKIHDAADPHSFIVSHKGVCVGVLTDIGACCKNVEHYFSLCHAAFLESNYDTDMLFNGRYPYFLKQRISGGEGHLSNHQALDLFLKQKNPQLSHLILSHLSRDNNSPQVAAALFEQHAGNVKITVASRFEETQVFYVSAQPQEVARKPKSSQLSLFQQEGKAQA